MNKEINLSYVSEIIEKYGYKYNLDIKKELNKTRKFTNEDIDQEIKEIFDLYKMMSNELYLIKLEIILKNYLKKYLHIQILK
ncbi:hypothetical protein P5F16_03385 [Clostridium perfringens]|nr:hypothetical protein [Clostridium perfringens]